MISDIQYYGKDTIKEFMKNCTKKKNENFFKGFDINYLLEYYLPSSRLLLSDISNVYIYHLTNIISVLFIFYISITAKNEIPRAHLNKIKNIVMKIIKNLQILIQDLTPPGQSKMISLFDSNRSLIQLFTLVVLSENLLSDINDAFIGATNDYLI